MPPVRPYFEAKISDLTFLAESNRENAPVLQTLQEELGHRSSQAALRLKKRIDDLLAALAAGQTTRNGGDPRGTSRAHENSRLVELESELRAARENVAALQLQLRGALDALERKTLEARLAAVWMPYLQRYETFGPEVFGLYAQVGLTPDCPDTVLKAAHKAYRREFHPDTKQPKEKKLAEEQFKKVELVFDEIYKRR